MDSTRGHKFHSQNKMRHFNKGRIGLNSQTLLVIKLHDSRFLHVMSRSLFLALVILTLPYIGSIFGGRSIPDFHSIPDSDKNGFEQLNLLFRDLADEGLLNKGHKALILNPGVEGLILIGSHHFDHIKVDFVMDCDTEQKGYFQDDLFDFVFTSSSDSVDVNFIDRVTKIGGIVIFPLSNNPTNAFPFQSNYKLVYLRRYSTMILAMRKTSHDNDHYLMNSSFSTSSRPLCQMALEEKKSALKRLEEVLLEPPRRSLDKPISLARKIKYLPDLTGDSLQGYRRRVFIDVGLPGENRGMIKWFQENYPKRSQEFEVYNIDVMPEEASGSLRRREDDVSDWLTKKKIKEDEYVVMKAEAQVVEKMIKRRTICLVDELFLECNNQWWQAEGGNKSKRPYWECLALYGRLRDGGVAVHQWWG